MIDPKNGIDAVLDIGIAGRSIARVASALEPSNALEAMDLDGMVAVPGVVDIHTHASRGELGRAAFKMMALGGTTTALELTGPPDVVLSNVASYGSGMNVAILDASVPGQNLPGPSANSQDVERFVDQSLSRGGYGVKILGGHYPFDPETTHDIIRQANERRAYVAYHVGTTATGSNLLGIREAIEMSRDCHMQVCHVNGALRGLVLGDRLLEVREALSLIARADNVVTESLLSDLSCDNAKCCGGVPASKVVQTSLKMMGFAPTEEGLREAIRRGPVRITVFRDGQIVLAGGEEGARAWEEAGTDIGMASPLNPRDLALICATEKDAGGRFVVDAIASDAGGYPRNVNVTYGLALVRFGAMSLADLVAKTSLYPSRIMGLFDKGHLGEGADADITVVDIARGRPYMTVVLGKVNMLDGKVLGDRGVIITTPAGRQAVEQTGLPCQVNEPGRGWLYKPKPGRAG